VNRCWREEFRTSARVTRHDGNAIVAGIHE
jgi:hypothetical protein